MKTILTTLLASAALAAGLAAAPVAGVAGECPAEQAGVDVRAPVDHEPVGVTDTVLETLPLSQSTLAIPDRTMRVRHLVIEPDGIVPWHSHGDRPALILVTKGEIEEYASTCAVPILHVAGEVAVERKETSHWWQNIRTQTAELYSFDILHDATDHNM